MNKNRLTITLVLLMIFAVVAVDLSRSAVRETAELSSADLQAQVEQSFGQLPLLFVENQGQWDEQVAYAVQGSDKTLYFTAEGVTFALTAPVEEVAEQDGRPDLGPRSLAGKPVRSERWAVKLDFLGANPGVRPVGEEGDSAVISYFKGQPDDWHAGLPTYRRIIYHDLWPGIDLVYEGTVNRLKYHFVVHPGADPNQVRLAYRGASDVSLNNAGQLVVETPVGSFADDTPVAYQDIEGERVLVDMGYVLESGTAESQPYHFDIGEYDPNIALVLDPVIIIYAGYIGGNLVDSAGGITLDESGNAYIVGQTSSSDTIFPVTIGPDLIYNGGALDAFVAKVNSDGTGLVYAGYIGGGNSDGGYDVAVDPAGNAYVTGYTLSDETTFPVITGPDLTYNGGSGGDIFVAKVSPGGNSLVYAGYIGGSNNELGESIVVNDIGNAYIAGFTDSDQSSFPVKIGPDLTHNGDYDAFVTKVSTTGTTLDYAGYIGGAGEERAKSIAIDGVDNVYITGYTFSDENTFPVIVGPDLTFNGDNDAFVVKVNVAGSELEYAGYVGGSDADGAEGIDVDSFGNAYITGATFSDETTFPVIIGPDLTFNGSLDAFVTKVNAVGDGFVYSGYIGGDNSDSAADISVDKTGNAYLVGVTYSNELTFPVLNGPDLTFNGNPTDAFIAEVNSVGDALVYSGYIGGNVADSGDGIVNDGSGSVFAVGVTQSTQSSFPVTVGPDLTHNGGSDVFIAKISIIYQPTGLEIIGPASGLIGAANVFTVTTMPLTTTIPLTYFWDITEQPFITNTNGLTDTAVFTWNITGPQYITITSWNLAGIVTDTHTITIYEPVSADFTATPTSGNSPLPVTFTNLSTGDFTTCLWDFGDGNTSSDCNLTSYLYLSPGIYNVTLTISGPGGTDMVTKVDYIVVNPTLYLPIILKP